MEKINVSIEGISPLLMNRFRDTAIEGKSKKRTGSIKDVDIKDKLYLVDDKPHIPSIYFRSCIVEAAKNFKIIGKGKSTYSRLAGATIDVLPDYILLNGSYEPYRVAAVNPMTKGRMMVTRPRFNKWSCSFEVILNDDSIPPDVLNELLEHAGRYVGVGDWRPEKKGIHGKFMITSFKVE